MAPLFPPTVRAARARAARGHHTHVPPCTPVLRPARVGWPSCTTFAADGGCAVPAPRAPNGSVIPDPVKFPEGLAAVFDYIHSLKLLVGIYSAPHGRTCGGYTGSLGHEAVDAQTWARWGVDAVKMDAGADPRTTAAAELRAGRRAASTLPRRPRPRPRRRAPPAQAAKTTAESTTAACSRACTRCATR